MSSFSYEQLAQVATSPKYQEIINVLIRTRGVRATARELGVHHSTVLGYVDRLDKAARDAGLVPEVDTANKFPAGQVVKAVSRLENADGEKQSQWIKTTRQGGSLEDTNYIPDPRIVKRQARLLDADGNVIQTWVTEEPNGRTKLEVWEAFASGLREQITPVDPTPAPAALNADLLTVYTMTDCHMGMLAWEDETGDNWDLDIAQRTLERCFAAMVERSPRSGTAVVAQLGDFLHYDSLEAVTPRSKHILDADSRFAKLVQRAVVVLRKLVTLALARHDKVYVLMAEGNHDMASSVWLRTLFGALYENEPRVEMIHSEAPYYALEFGANMLTWHHGHLKSRDSIHEFIAARYAEIWGRTKYRVCHMGDKHHRNVTERAGITVEQHETLAAADAYAARGGWMSHRRATAITYHRQYGESSRVTVTPYEVDTVEK